MIISDALFKLLQFHLSVYYISHSKYILTSINRPIITHLVEMNSDEYEGIINFLREGKYPPEASIT